MLVILLPQEEGEGVGQMLTIDGRGGGGETEMFFFTKSLIVYWQVAL